MQEAVEFTVFPLETVKVKKLPLESDDVMDFCLSAYKC